MKETRWFGTPMAAALLVGVLAGVLISVFRTVVINEWIGKGSLGGWKSPELFTGAYYTILLAAPFVCLKEPRKLMQALAGGVLIGVINYASFHSPVFLINAIHASPCWFWNLSFKALFWGGQLACLGILGAATAWMYGFRSLRLACAAIAALALPVQLALQQVVFIFNRATAPAEGAGSVSPVQVDQWEVSFYFFNIISALILAFPVAFVIERKMRRSSDASLSTSSPCRQTDGSSGMIVDDRTAADLPSLRGKTQSLHGYASPTRKWMIAVHIGSVATSAFAVYWMGSKESRPDIVLIEGFSRNGYATNSLTVERQDLDDNFDMLHAKLSQFSRESLDRADIAQIGWVKPSKNCPPFSQVQDLMKMASQTNAVTYGTIFRVSFVDTMWVLEMSVEARDGWLKLGQAGKKSDLSTPLTVALYEVAKANLQNTPLPSSSTEFAGKVGRKSAQIDQVKARLGDGPLVPVDISVEGDWPESPPSNAASPASPVPSPGPQERRSSP